MASDQVRTEINALLMERLESICAANKWSISSVLEAAGTGAHAHSWRAGKSSPTAVTLVKLARALGISPRELLPEK